MTTQLRQERLAAVGITVEDVPQSSDRADWIAWLESYDIGRLFDSILANCQGAEARCAQRDKLIYFDIVEGGGVPDWKTADGDYGCFDSPDTCEDGTGGHVPRKLD